MTLTELEYHYTKHLAKQEKIWNDLYWKLYSRYLDQGYNMWFAQVKAEREVLELRSMPNNGVDS